MARKETVNTFTDGLITDLNPINTPNTVLTDCLNGTLITYDGNEYSLQNDKGNYPLKDCKLPQNYIPVGVKEYADILYIISYNPLNKHVQVGSYPSPETKLDASDYKFNNGNNDLSKQVPSIWDTINSAEEKNYSDIKEENYIYYGTPPEQFLLNPGDKYQVVVPVLPSNQFESLNYFIMDNDKKIHDVTSEVKDNVRSLYDQYGYTYVSWNIPGYFGVKMHCAEIEDFKVNVRRVISPTYISDNQSPLQKLELNIQTFISDYLLFADNLFKVNTTGNLGFKIDVFRNNSEISIGSSTNYYVLSDLINLNNGLVYYFKNIDVTNVISNTSSIEPNDIIKVRLTPILVCSGKTVVYDKYIKELTFNLSQKGSVESFNIGNSIWKYTTNDSLTLTFDTSGIQENSVLNADVHLYYEVCRYITDSIVVTDSNGNNVAGELDEWNITGITELEIPFVEFPNSSSTYVANKFYAEDFYIITFIFKDDNGNILRDNIQKVILASKLLNDYDSDQYDKIYFDQWINRYVNFVENPTMEVSSTVTYPDFSSQNPPTVNDELSPEYKIWVNSKKIEKYPTIIPFDVYEDNLQNGFDLSASIKLNNVSITCRSDVKLPVGPLWLSLNASLDYSINQSAESNTINMYTGKSTASMSRNSTNEYFKKTNHYSLYKQGQDFTAFDYSLDDLNTNPDYSCALGITGSFDSESHIIPTLKIENTKNKSYDYSFPNSTNVVPNTSDNTYILRSYQNTTTAGIKNLISHANGVDILLLGVVIYKPTEKSDGRPDDLAIKIKTSDLWSEGQVYTSISENSSDPWSRGYFAVIRVPDEYHEYKLWFIPILNAADDDDAYTKLNNFMRDIKYFSRGSYEVFGSFYTAEGPTDMSKNSLDLNVKAEVNIKSWYYAGQNMLDFSRRLSLTTNKPSSNFFSISSPGNDVTSLSSIILSANSNTVNIDGTEEMNNRLTNRLNTLDQQVQDRNSAVLLDFSNCASDSIYTMGNNSKSRYIETGLFYNNQLLSILNGELTTGVPIMVAASDTYTSNGPKTGRVALYLGIVDNDIKIT